MSGRRVPKQDSSGSMRLLVGGVVIIGSLFLLVPGINQLSAMVYRNEDGDGLAVALLLGMGAALFLAGVVLMLTGLLRRRAHNKRVVSYDDLEKAEHGIDEPYLGEGRRVSAGRLESRIRRRNRYRHW